MSLRATVGVACGTAAAWRSREHGPSSIGLTVFRRRAAFSACSWRALGAHIMSLCSGVLGDLLLNGRAVSTGASVVVFGTVCSSLAARRPSEDPTSEKNKCPASI